MGCTDGTYVCALCGEWSTGCSLCGEAPLLDRREALMRERADAAKAEQELLLQERSIRKAAETR